MEYSAVHNGFIITQEELMRCSEGIKWAMKKYRQSTNTPLNKRPKGGNLSDIDLAERELLQSLKSIGINMGAEWGWQLDLSSSE